MKPEFLALAVVAGLMCLPAQAQRGPVRAGVCAPDNAEQASLGAIAGDPDGWLGRCVTVAGIYSNEQIYADADAIYGKSGASIGGYVDGQGSLDGFWRGEFTGRIGDCAVAANNIDAGLLRSPGILIDGRQAGCREPTGQFLLFMSQGKLERTKLVRRMRNADDSQGGDLRPAPKDWPQADEVSKLAAEFVGALRAGDRARLTGMMKDAYGVELLLDDEPSALADLKTPGDHPMQILLRRGVAADVADTKVCFCHKKDCSALWPIDRRDADNQPSRPYACLAIKGRRTGADGAWAYDVHAMASRDGLPEPAPR